MRTKTQRHTPGQFDYVNQYYGLDLKKHSAVIQKGGRRGQVVSAEGAYIYIQWDGEAKPHGPHHPTWELSYPQAEGQEIGQ